MKAYAPTDAVRAESATEESCVQPSNALSPTDATGSAETSMPVSCVQPAKAYAGMAWMALPRAKATVRIPAPRNTSSASAATRAGTVTSAPPV